MIFDTDILIWVQRGNEKAANLIEKDKDKHLSIQSYMELLQGARNKTHPNLCKAFIAPLDVIKTPNLDSCFKTF